MERIVVTGGHGMLGRHVVAALEPDYHVTVVDRIDGGSHQPPGPVDAMDLEALERAVRDHHAIIHLAAIDAAVDARAHEFFHVNAVAAWNTLHAGYEEDIEGIGEIPARATGSARRSAGRRPGRVARRNPET